MTYEEAVAYLNSLIDYEKRVPGKYDTGTYNLDAFRCLVERLGRPDREFASVHVAGTDGKGSVCAFVESILRHAGLRTGFYSSPHLVSYLERIRLDGEPVAPGEFAGLVAEIRGTLEEIQREQGTPSRRGFATVFEILTAAAFLAFARPEVDAAVVEVGLGGRLDATNVITPALSVITPVDRDHTKLLGDTPAKIALEKGGIIKPGVPVVLGSQSAEVAAVLENIAGERRSRVIRADDAYRVEICARDPEGYRFDLHGDRRNIRDLQIPLLGNHQARNARTAVVAAGEFLRARGAELDEEAIRDGLAHARWPGRCEPVTLDPGDGTAVRAVLDCGHTAQAGRALRSTLEEVFPPGPMVFLVGMSADKHTDDFLREVLRDGDILIATRSDSPRAVDPRDLAKQALEVSGPLRRNVDAEVTGTWEEGLLLAGRIARETDRLLCVAGSIYLVGLVRGRSGSAQAP